MRRAPLLAAALMLSACAQRHGLADAAPVADAGPELDAAHDGAPPDAAEDGGARGDAGDVPCGRNQCFHGEVCCSWACGICATAGTCPTGPPCF